MVDETSFIRLKKAILELKDGYPEYIFWGKIEYFSKTGIGAVNLLVKHGIIERITQDELDNMPQDQLEKLGENKSNSYRLTAKGVDLAISMINLAYSEDFLQYNKTMKKLTIWVIILSALTLSLGIIQIFGITPYISNILN